MKPWKFSKPKVRLSLFSTFFLDLLLQRFLLGWALDEMLFWVYIQGVTHLHMQTKNTRMQKSIDAIRIAKSRMSIQIKSNVGSAI